MSVIAAAEALCGLSYSAARDAYVSALYPHDDRGAALSMARGQSACGLVCEAVLRAACGIDAPAYAGSLTGARLPAVVWQREAARARGAWVDAMAWDESRQLPSVGAMVEVGGSDSHVVWSDPGVYGGPHVETLVGGQKFEAEAIAGGQPDAANGYRPTAIKRVYRRFDERPGQLWLVDPETRKGRRVSGWIDTSLL